MTFISMFILSHVIENCYFMVQQIKVKFVQIRIELHERVVCSPFLIEGIFYKDSQKQGTKILISFLCIREYDI